MTLPRLTFTSKSAQALTAEERRADDDKTLITYTNVNLLIAVLIGVAMAYFHGGIVTASISAFGAAVGLGGVLGFLFGVPGPRTPGASDNTDTANITTGAQSVVTVQAGNQPPITPPAVAPHTVALIPAAATPFANVADPKAAGASTTPPAVTPPTRSTSIQAVTPASNLEQVADWVTKLLLGGGLTQMSRIPPKIWEWSHAVAVGIAGSESGRKDLTADQAFAAGLLVYGFILGFFGGFLITKIALGKAISS